MFACSHIQLSFSGFLSLSQFSFRFSFPFTKFSLTLYIITFSFSHLLLYFFNFQFVFSFFLFCLFSKSLIAFVFFNVFISTTTSLVSYSFSSKKICIHKIIFIFIVTIYISFQYFNII